ncbi:MAG TPA: serine hydrolase domain-containing protein [Longimicrobium sp.]|nr:serine hydrolase domain-containing protein [Longimicrobium sp.]
MQTRFSPTVLAFALTTLVATNAAAQTGRARAERLDSLAGSGVVENRAVGTVAAVVMGNDTLLMKGYGRANVEWDVPMPADAVFEIGSVTKQFTAAAILQLRDAGKLSLDDEITKWLPDFDMRGNKVTVRRLLDHTSGIVGLTEMPEFDLLVWNQRFPRDSAYALIKRYPFQFPTGTAQIYNNSAFFLAGLIIEKASGMTYEDYIEQRIFAPLGMTHSMYCNSGESVPRRANGYRVQNGVIGRAPANVHTWPFAAGSLCSTAGDLVTWVNALHGGKVLSPKSYQEMITPSTLNDGTPLRYGLGIGVGKDARGLTYIGHGGSITGFTAEAGWYPAARLAVVVLTNSSGNIDAGDIARELAAALLPGEGPTVARFTGDAAPLVGTYKGPGRGRDMVIQVTQAPQGIAVSINGGSPRPVPWVEGMTFRLGGNILTFRGGDLHLSGGSAYTVLKRQ